MKTTFLLLLFSLPAFAQNPPTARRDIDAGNQAWVDAMKTGNIAAVVASYADDALDCGPTGDCIKGRAAYEQKMKDRVATLGHARSALVHTASSTQQGDFIYEWGSARAEFANGKKIEGRYLTVWQRQPDGHWRIFRNLSIPPDNRSR